MGYGYNGVRAHEIRMGYGTELGRPKYGFRYSVPRLAHKQEHYKRLQEPQVELFWIAFPIVNLSLLTIHPSISWPH